MSSAAPRTARALDRRGKWFLVALCLAALAALGLLVPSILAWTQRAEDTGTVSAVEVSIVPLTSAQLKRCADVDETSLDRATTAVTGVWTKTDGDTATFDADHWFRGGPAEKMLVTAETPATLEKALQQAGIGSGRVLIASRSGEVLLCGESGAYTQELAALYVATYEQS